MEGSGVASLFRGGPSCQVRSDVRSMAGNADKVAPRRGGAACSRKGGRKRVQRRGGIRGGGEGDCSEGWGGDVDAVSRGLEIACGLSHGFREGARWFTGVVWGALY